MTQFASLKFLVLSLFEPSSAVAYLPNVRIWRLFAIVAGIESLGAIALLQPSLAFISSGTALNESGRSIATRIVVAGDLLHPVILLLGLSLVVGLAFVLLVLQGMFADPRETAAIVIASHLPISLGAVAAAIVVLAGGPITTAAGLDPAFGLDMILKPPAGAMRAAVQTFSVFMCWSLFVFILLFRRRGVPFGSAVAAATAVWAPQLFLRMTTPVQ